MQLIIYTQNLNNCKFAIVHFKIQQIAMLSFNAMLITDIFNSREIAIFICIFIPICISVFYKSVRDSLIDLFKAIFNFQILSVFIFAIIYTFIGVFILYYIKFWDWSQLKDTIMWLMFSASITLFNIQKANDNRHYFKDAVKDNFKFSVIVEFITGKYTFNLLIEIAFVIISFLIGGILATAGNDKKYEGVKKLINIIILVLGINLLSYSIYQLVDNFITFATIDTLKEFSLPIILALWFMPFIYVVFVYMNYELIFLGVNWSIENSNIRSFAKKQAAISFKTDFEALKRWRNVLTTSDIKTKQDVLKSICTIKELQVIEKNPPVVPPHLGWSPYKAKDFLKRQGIETGFYSRCYDNEWQGGSKSIKLDSELIANDVTYYVSGDSSTVTSLKLLLNVYSKENEKAIIEIFNQYARVLHENAFNKKLPDEISHSIKKKESRDFTLRNVFISVAKREWDNIDKGYGMTFHILFKPITNK